MACAIWYHIGSHINDAGLIIAYSYSALSRLENDNGVMTAQYYTAVIYHVMQIGIVQRKTYFKEGFVE